ncbi:putative TTHA0068-like superfamily protein [Arabidopsis thaliana]|jgi:hypothetical protein|uniref:DUF309 domain-containing protein n=4 Tax=Arabidopsis TaxID=3701 RepID=A0A178VWN8_ARATH|nr:DUF309 domain protein [Arabidopsis thaliana]KAG7639290.1 hypothetical protein ISN45_At02g036230 [Arabidopsis thaliana x Arabidopsis arenosa]KAG7643878.1 hypothetical protein ISN44_As02g036370 [Arabidopsis suecica]AAD11999.1 hypothetical protein [Arabidopsis thaliana]AAR23729.1 At2g41120 [Arabidopsis thaliana]AAR24759.1 At2g41120 [Arabidopsis thaliana]|eukprot:NP_181645.1 DUF309 domain protein [Arabidopsis thaliana]
MAVSSKHFQVPSSFTLPPSSFFSSLIPSSPISVTASTIRASTKFSSIRVRFSRRSIVRYNDHAGEDEEDSDEDKEEYWSFEEAVTLFNKRDYYKSHDALEALWIQAEEPTRTLIHGILQCAVGFHHLFNNNHKGAMMELGEGVCKLRKMNFEDGPFHEFERDVSAVLEFVYQTQLELAACSEDMCLTMDQSDRSYQLLGGYAAGESIYSLETVLDFNNGMSETTSILFSPLHSSSEPTRVKLPTLTATDKHLLASTYDDRF